MWIIKVLNGPNTGGQILVSGEILAGTDLSCDLILNDPHIAPHHCRLKKGGDDSQKGYLEVAPEEGATFLNGHQVDKKGARLNIGDVLTLGSTHLTAGPSEQLWPPVTIPEIQEVGGKAEDPQPEEKKEGETAPATDPEEASEEASATEPKLPHFPNYLLSTLGLVITLLLFCFGIFLIIKVISQSQKPAPKNFTPQAIMAEDKTPSQKQELKVNDDVVEKVKKLIPQSYIKVDRRKGDDMIYIYVVDEKEQARVRQAMNTSNIPVPYNIITLQNIEESAQAMVQSLDVAIHAKVGRNGDVTWIGYLPNQELLNNLQEQVKRDISAIHDNKFDITLGDAAVSRITTFLSKKGFVMITVIPEHNDITLSGIIPSTSAKKWYATLNQLKKDVEGVIPIINLVKLSSRPFAAPPALFGSPIVSISISDTPYATLQNGEKLFTGAKAKNGYMIKSISSDGITITNGFSTKILPLDQNKMHEQ